MPLLNEQQQEEPSSLSAWSWTRRIGYLSMTAARYLLGLGMFPYAWSKINDLQFQVGASTYAKRLGESSGYALTWAYLGHSPAFQILLGVLEAVPASLLLWTRTRRLGAVLMFPVLLNVVLVNFFFDLWHDTKVISSVLLGLNIFLLAYDWRLFLGLWGQLIAKPLSIGRRRWRIVANVCAACLPVAGVLGWIFVIHQEIKSLEPLSDLIGMPQINRAGTWKIASLMVDGKAVNVDSQTRMYFDFWQECSIWNGSQFIKGSFKANRAQHTLHIERIPFGGDSAPLDGIYRAEGDRLLLDGHQGQAPVMLTLSRDGWGQHSP